MSKVIIFPTDTVYGIGCPIFDIKGIEKIYKIKHRSKDKPLACLCSSLEQIEEIAQLNPNIRNLIEQCMPGALTLILPAKTNVLEAIGYKTIGVRIPNSSLALQLLNAHGPMLTTSVNESGEMPLNDYETIVAQYQDVVDKIYPPQKNSSNISSTVIDLTTGEMKLLREGTLAFEQIKIIYQGKA